MRLTRFSCAFDMRLLLSCRVDYTSDEEGAKALDLTVPISLLVRADKVIE
jgi:hypothetical protein